MLRQPFLTAASVLLCSTAAAQQADPSLIRPIAVPISDAGTLDLTTRSWLGSAPEYLGKIYDNTCQWTGGGFYAVVEHCTDAYDEGRIPCWNEPNAPPGAEHDNWIDSFQIGYCTGWPTGQVDVRIAFWDYNGGGCVGWTAQQAIAPATGYNGATAYFDLSGHNLPGDNSGGGNLACWIVTVALGDDSFCLMSDGDGSWNGADEEFSWSFQHENDNAVFGVGTGPIVAGDPLSGVFGACTYSIPCGTAGATPCGTGLGTADQVWYNVDGCPASGTGCSGVPSGSCPSAPSPGTACYWFGGWPANPFASFHLELTSLGACIPDPVIVYCSYNRPSTGTSCGFDQCPSSGGCEARITTSNPSVLPVQNADDYDVIVRTADSGRPGLIFGSVNGQARIPFSSGTLCVEPPIKRTPPQNSGGTGGCTGTLTLRINDPATSGPILNLPPGSYVFYQGWLRDPMGASGTDVSDAITVGFE